MTRTRPSGLAGAAWRKDPSSGWRREAPDARAISVSLPLQAAPFSHRESRPFFEGLLSEESQRTAVAFNQLVSGAVRGQDFDFKCGKEVEKSLGKALGKGLGIEL